MTEWTPLHINIDIPLLAALRLVEFGCGSALPDDSAMIIRSCTSCGAINCCESAAQLPRTRAFFLGLFVLQPGVENIKLASWSIDKLCQSCF